MRYVFLVKMSLEPWMTPPYFQLRNDSWQIFIISKKKDETKNFVIEVIKGYKNIELHV